MTKDKKPITITQDDLVENQSETTKMTSSKTNEIFQTKRALSFLECLTPVTLP